MYVETHSKNLFDPKCHRILAAYVRWPCNSDKYALSDTRVYKNTCIQKTHFLLTYVIYFTEFLLQIPRVHTPQ